VEDQVISQRIVKEPQKPAAKAVKTAAVISEMIRSALLPQVKKVDAAEATIIRPIGNPCAAGFARR